MLTTGKHVVEWIASRTGEFNNFGTNIGIGWERAGMLTWGVAYTNWNGANIEAHIASDGTKPYMPQLFLRAIFDYPFRQLGCNRITTCVAQDNAASRHLTQRLGFKQEAELKGAHRSGSLFIYRMFRTECRYIEAQHEKLAA